MRLSRRFLMIPLLATALVSPAIADPVLAQTGPVTVQLAAQNDSGINGTATLTAMGQQTKVVVNVTGGIPARSGKRYTTTAFCGNPSSVGTPIRGSTSIVSAS